LPKSGFVQRQGELAQVRAKVAFIDISEGRLGLHELMKRVHQTTADGVVLLLNYLSLRRNYHLPVNLLSTENVQLGI
jgi:hypothetical protein